MFAFLRSRRKHPHSGNIEFAHSEELSTGAAGYVMLPSVTQPMTCIQGAGMFAGSMRITSKPARVVSATGILNGTPTEFDMIALQALTKGKR